LSTTENEERYGINNKLMKDPETVLHRAKSLVNQLIVLKGEESVEVDRLMGKFADALKQV